MNQTQIGSDVIPLKSVLIWWISATEFHEQANTSNRSECGAALTFLWCFSSSSCGNFSQCDCHKQSSLSTSTSSAPTSEFRVYPLVARINRLATSHSTGLVYVFTHVRKYGKGSDHSGLRSKGFKGVSLLSHTSTSSMLTHVARSVVFPQNGTNFELVPWADFFSVGLKVQCFSRFVHICDVSAAIPRRTPVLCVSMNWAIPSHSYSHFRHVY